MFLPKNHRSRRYRRLALASGVCWLLGCSAVTTVDLFPAYGVGGGAGNAARPSFGLGGVIAVGGAIVGTSAGPNAGSGAMPTTVNSSPFLGSEAGYSNANGGTATVSSGSIPAVAAGAGVGPKLLNRYDFSGTGTTIADRVGGMDGAALGGATLDGSGQLTLGGGSQQYVALPAWLISSMTSVTIVAFITWHGGPAWQSVFNFGATDSGKPSEDVRAQFFFTPLTSVGNGPSLHVEMTYGHGPLDFVDGTERFPVDVPAVVAAVFDGEQGELSLYINGSIVLQPDRTTQRLAELKDANCWLGQSQWAHDVTAGGNFRGSYDEFRIYAGALSAKQIANLSLSEPEAL